LIFLAGCVSSSEKVSINGKLIDIDTIQYFSFEDSRSKFQSVVKDMIGLDSLKNPQDWLEIRIDRYHSDSEPFRMFIMKRMSGSWSGYGVLIIPQHDAKTDRIRYVPRPIKTIAPTGGWG
jgi:hypothetical protein